jgi:hypothetical protein
MIRRDRIARPALSPLAVFAAALLLATALTALAVDTQPALGAAAAVAQGERPPDDDRAAPPRHR